MFSYLTSSMYTQYCPLNQSKANQKLSGSSESCISVSVMDVNGCRQNESLIKTSQ